MTTIVIRESLAQAPSPRQAIRTLHARLRQAGIATAQVEAEWLVAESLGLSRTGVYVHDRGLDEPTMARLHAWLARRLEGVPLQYVIGATEFYGYRLVVTPAVLIPRPETEVLVERTIRHLRDLAKRRGRPLQAIDLGTGSGNIAISLAGAIATCVVTAVELSWDALQIARRNIAAHRLGERIRCLRTEWTSGVRGPVDVLISNPPYVATAALSRLPRDVRQEPRLGLDGGVDGMACHRRLIADAPRILAGGGVLAMECDEPQTSVLMQQLREQPWVSRVEGIRDLTGRLRGVWAQRRVL